MNILILYLVFNCRQQRSSNVVFRYGSSRLCIGYTCRGWIRRVRCWTGDGSWSRRVRWVSPRIRWVRSRSWSIHRWIWRIWGSRGVGGGRCRVRWITWNLFLYVSKSILNKSTINTTCQGSWICCSRIAWWLPSHWIDRGLFTKDNNHHLH